MSVYSRYKRQPDGFRALVELLESTPSLRRKKMIDVGRIEDPDYTEDALRHMMSFEDILGMPDMELAEVVAEAPPKMTAFAIAKASDAIKTRFVRCASPQRAAEIRDFLDEATNLGAADRGGAQLKVVEAARALERRGVIRTKRIPTR